VVGVLAVLSILAGLAAYSALNARSHASRALTEFQYVQRNLASASTTRGRANLEAHLETALSESQEASSSLTSTVVLGAVQWIPYFGDEIKGAQKLFTDASTAAQSGLNILHALDRFQTSDASGDISSVGLTALQREVALATSKITSLDRPVGSLFGPVGRERAMFNGKVARAVSELKNVSNGLSVGREILGIGGSSTILVLPENNAEMRDQGTILSYSLVRTRGASFTVLRSGSVADINLNSPLNVPASPGTRAFFYGWGANEIFQSVNGTADFSWTGATAAAMFKKATGITVNAVIALDVPAMAALVGVTGPLTIPGIPEQLTSSNFSTVVLHDLYAQYPVGTQVARNTELNAIATELLQRLRSARHDQVSYLRALAGQIPGRHLLLWSADPSVERAIVQLGASGKVDMVLPKRTFHVAVESAVAAKLDYYVSVHESFNVTVLAGGDAWVATTVTVHNNAPAGQAPSYQLGPDNINSHVPGEYVSNICLWSPAGSKVIGGKSESGLVLNGFSTDVFAQHSTSTPFSTYLPLAVVGGKFVLHLVPQPTLNPATVSVSVHGAGWAVSGPKDSFSLIRPTTLTYSLVAVP
jgi:type II secretory pathway pseudopilin PulG